MADISSYVSATIARQLPGIQDAVIERNVLLKALKSKGRIKFGVGGDSIKWRVYVTEPTVFGSTTDWASRGAQTIQPFQTAEVRYAQYDGSIMLNEFQTMRNKNAEQNVKLFDQLAEELNVFSQQAISRIGKHAYNGTGTTYTGDQGTSINGLIDFVTGSTVTYAGLSEATYAVWAAQDVTISPASVSAAEIDTDGNNVPQLLEAMRQLWMNCSGGANPDTQHISDQLATDKETPDLIITTKAVYINYDNCLFANMRYTSGGSRDPQGKLFFDGIPIQWDTFVPAGKLFMLNSKHIQLDCCTKQMIEAPENLQAVPVVDKNAAVWKMLGQLQLYCKNRRYQGILRIS